MKNLIVVIISAVFFLTLNSCKQKVTSGHNNEQGEITGSHNNAGGSYGGESVISPYDLEKMDIKRVEISITYKNRKSIGKMNILKKDYEKIIGILLGDTLVGNIKVTPLKK